jgi:hypothetical protein
MVHAHWRTATGPGCGVTPSTSRKKRRPPDVWRMNWISWCRAFWTLTLYRRRGRNHSRRQRLERDGYGYRDVARRQPITVSAAFQRRINIEVRYGVRRNVPGPGRSRRTGCAGQRPFESVENSAGGIQCGGRDGSTLAQPHSRALDVGGAGFLQAWIHRASMPCWWQRPTLRGTCPAGSGARQHVGVFRRWLCEPATVDRRVDRSINT